MGTLAAMSTNGRGLITLALQAPTNYTGIYDAWDVNGDDLWDFSNTGQYPLLKVDFNGDGVPTWQEFGMQAITEAQAVALASNALMIAYTSPDTSNMVTANVMLARNIGHGVSITWGSSTPSVIAVNGEVTRPALGEADATVTLTATLSKGATTATKNFILTVLSPRLIEVTNLDQLNAIRYDLDGNGEADNASDRTAYNNAFPGLDTNQSYRGYKLMTTLDFASSDWASNRGNGRGWQPSALITKISTTLLQPSLRAIATSSPVCTSIDLALIT